MRITDNDCVWPDRYRYQSPGDFSPPAQVHHFESDGLLLEGWLLQPVGQSRGLVLHAHGNAQNLTAHVSLVTFLVRAGYSLFVMDYRGFGGSRGTPSLQGARRDVEAAGAYLRSQHVPGSERLILFGQSMGAAMAGLAAEAIEPALLILEAGFGSYPALYGGRYPGATLELSLTERVDEAIARLACPVGLIHGMCDEVVPFVWQEKFACALHGKAFWRFDLPGEGHLTVQGGRQALWYQEKILEEIGRVLRPSRGSV